MKLPNTITSNNWYCYVHHVY